MNNLKMVFARSQLPYENFVPIESLPVANAKMYASFFCLQGVVVNQIGHRADKVPVALGSKLTEYEHGGSLGGSAHARVSSTWGAQFDPQSKLKRLIKSTLAYQASKHGGDASFPFLV
jgi:hypothetical protein